MQQEPDRHTAEPCDAGLPIGLVGAEGVITASVEKDVQDQVRVDVAHELRTSLAIITLLSGNLDILYERLDDVKRRRMIRDIRKHTQRLSDSIKDVLEGGNESMPISV